MAILVFLPLMALGFSGEMVMTVGKDHQLIRAAIMSGKISRKHAILSGLVAGIMAVILVLATWHIGFFISSSTSSAIMIIVLIILEIMMLPVIAAVYLIEFAKRQS